MNKVPKELMMEIPVNCWTDFLMEFEEVLEKVARLDLKLVDMQIQNDMLQTNLESLKKEFQDDSTDRFARIPP